MKYKYSTIITCFLILFAIVIVGCNKSCPKGPEKTNCFCYTDYNPVCGCDNVTYSNACRADCANVSSYTQGECD